MPNRCPKCGKILNGSNICPVCGSAAVSVNVQKQQSGSEKVICRNCGKVYQNKKQICPVCGAKNAAYVPKAKVSVQVSADDHCPNCGKKLGSAEMICPVCGYVKQGEPKPKPNPKPVPPIPAPVPPKHRRSLLPLLLPIAAVVSVATVIYVYRSTSSNMPETAPANADAAANLVTAQQTVGEALNEVMSTDEFDKADIDTRKELVSGALDDMQEQGYIQEPVYNAVSELYEYDYTAGGKGGVMLVEFSDDVSGIAKDYADKDSSGKVINVKNKLEYDTSKYSYKEKDLSAKVMYGLGYDEMLRELKNRDNVWNSEGLKAYIDEDCTVEDFADSLGECSFLDIREHGMMYQETPVICTMEIVTEDNLIKYLDDVLNDRVILINFEDDPSHAKYVLMPDFFTKHYQNNELSNTIIYIGACHAYQNDKLVSSFKKSGAKSVVACTDMVYSYYNYYIVDAFVYSLLSGDTVNEALKYATDMWGGDDIQWAKKYFASNADIKAEIAVPKIACGGDQRLVTVVEKDEAKTPELVKKIVSWTADKEPGAGDTWIDTFEMYESYRDKYGFEQNEMWFQDLDGDGTPELIVGGYGMRVNEPEQHFFAVYNKSGSVEDGLTTLWTSRRDYGHKAFTLQAYKDSSGNLSFADGELYEYTSPGQSSGDGAYGLYTFTFGNSGSWTKSEEKFYFTKSSDNGSEVYNSFKVSGSSVDAGKFKSSFNSYFSGKTPLKANVKTILLTDYKSMTQAEREQALTESYNAFSYKEDSSISAPLSDMVNSISEKAEEPKADSSSEKPSDNSQEQKQNTSNPFAVYADKLAKLYAEKSGASPYYYVVDLDLDGNYELVWIDEGGASTSEARVFKADSSGNLADLGTFNCGGRAQLLYSSYYGCFVTDYLSTDVNDNYENIEFINKVSVSSGKVSTEKVAETSMSERDAYGLSSPTAGYSYDGGGADEVKALAMSNQF